MHLTSLRPYHYRNLSDQTVKFNQGINFFVGKNGQGKTNLVEAISLLSWVRSFRTNDFSELVRWGETSASIFGTIVLDREKLDLELGIIFEEQGRKLLINSQPSPSAADFIGKLLCVAFTPTDISLIKDSAGVRRRFIDKYISDITPGMYRELLRYQKALRSKNALLKEKNSGADEIYPWNKILAESGIKIHQSRELFIENLSSEAAKIYALFAEGKDGLLELKLKSNLKLDKNSDISDFENALNKGVQKEIYQRSATLGPQRDDILITLGGNDTRAFASQGQARSAVLAIKLALLKIIEEKRSEPPILLLDDVESELDPTRNKTLFELVRNGKNQVFITGTELKNTILERFSDVFVLQVEGGSFNSISCL